MNKFRFSGFGERYSGHTGILDLMIDLSGEPENPNEPFCMLGGGNPAIIPEVAALWESRFRELLADPASFAKTIGAYESQLGSASFRKTIALMFHEKFGFPITERNVAVVNGSQIAFFYLINMFSGEYAGGKRKKILLPVVPDYIGYADQGLDPLCFSGRRPKIEMKGDNSFKYRVNFDKIGLDDSIGAICVSRPTNPTGNVISDDEIRKLAGIAEERGIPLIVDNAYGLPFPGIIFKDAEPFWNESVILSMSLSKIGLPSLRTGIIIAREEIIEALSAINAIISLATGSMGTAVAEPLIRSGELLRLAREVVRPYYKERSRRTIARLTEELVGLPWAVHESEGAIFLWLWFKDLPLSSRELYQRLKARNVVVVPGEYFFFGLEGDWPHSRQCIRLNYSAPWEFVERGIGILGEELRKAYMGREGNPF